MEVTQSTNPPTFESVWAALQETDRIVKENARQMKETDRQMGYLSNRFGELAEHMVAPSIKEKFNELGFHFTETATDKKFLDPENPNNNTEVDVFLENGDIAIAVEVKAKPKREDVDYQIWRMGVIRRHADRKYDKRRFQGAIAGAILGEDERRYILKNGFYLIEQTGDTVQITIPEGFKARDW
jgi:predicted AAA+ superfamily ATPase